MRIQFLNHISSISNVHTLTGIEKLCSNVFGTEAFSFVGMKEAQKTQKVNLTSWKSWHKSHKIMKLSSYEIIKSVTSLWQKRPFYLRSYL